MCTLKELQDGTYTLYDLEFMHQLIELKNHIKYVATPEQTPKQEYSQSYFPPSAT